MEEGPAPGAGAEPVAPLGERMERDHDRLNDLWDEARRLWPEDRGRSTPLFEAFRTGLLHHIREEEEFMFPLYESRNAASAKYLTDFLREEHDQIRSELESLLRKVLAGVADLEPENTRLTNVLWAHNTREEGLLYPWFDEDRTEGERLAP